MSRVALVGCALGLSCAAPVEAAPAPRHALQAATRLITPVTDVEPAVTPSSPEVEPEAALDASDDGESETRPSETGEPTPWPQARWPAISKIRPIVETHAATYGLDPDLICAVIWVESKFNPKARGPSGARGLMQIMPGTGKHLAKRIERKYAPYDADTSVQSGAYLLRRLLDRFGGDERLALAGYNRGGGTVAHWVAEKEPLPEGVQKFVDKVLAAKAKFAGTKWPAPAARSLAD